jgi:hypothetical protein
MQAITGSKKLVFCHGKDCEPLKKWEMGGRSWAQAPQNQEVQPALFMYIEPGWLAPEIGECDKKFIFLNEMK